MSHQSRSTIRRLQRGVAAVALAALTGIGATLPALADNDEGAKELFKEMTAYMAAQSALSFSYGADLEVVMSDLQKIGFASAGTVTMSRPDKLQVTRTGGFADAEMAYDGKKLTIKGTKQNVFTSTQVSGSVDELIDMLRIEHDVEAPAGDLLSAKAYDIMMADVTGSSDLGTGVIAGKVCDHLAFRTPQTDWQIWIAQGDKPYPCRFEITSKLVSQAPSYRVEFSDWKTGADVAKSKFEVEQGDAKVVPIDEFPVMSEIKEIVSEGMSQ